MSNEKPLARNLNDLKPGNLLIRVNRNNFDYPDDPHFVTVVEVGEERFRTDCGSWLADGAAWETGGTTEYPYVRAFAEGETPESYRASVEAAQKAAIAVLDEFDVSSQKYRKHALRINKRFHDDAVLLETVFDELYVTTHIGRHQLKRTILCNIYLFNVKIDETHTETWCQVIATGFIHNRIFFQKASMTVTATAIGRGEDPIQNAIDNLILKLW